MVIIIDIEYVAENNPITEWAKWIAGFATICRWFSPWVNAPGGGERKPSDLDSIGQPLTFARCGTMKIYEIRITLVQRSMCQNLQWV